MLKYFENKRRQREHATLLHCNRSSGYNTKLSKKRKENEEGHGDPGAGAAAAAFSMSKRGQRLRPCALVLFRVRMGCPWLLFFSSLIYPLLETSRVMSQNGKTK